MTKFRHNSIRLKNKPSRSNQSASPPPIWKRLQMGNFFISIGATQPNYPRFQSPRSYSHLLASTALRRQAIQRIVSVGIVSQMPLSVVHRLYSLAELWLVLDYLAFLTSKQHRANRITKLPCYGLIVSRNCTHAKWKWLLKRLFYLTSALQVVELVCATTITQWLHALVTVIGLAVCISESKSQQLICLQIKAIEP